ncbi:hypothetical protein B0H66DRAFT_608205 [Apodospora peruviana]|uniref:N-acetyltransferase domain-containing protein n=1 Tax=Apodospora peruviana TaxID=516989 RepID=A0AAE0HV44_9PEZI|nr:hypothetical protein B0H66DRAFT_608205 [Apodospora peruviana]
MADIDWRVWKHNQQDLPFARVLFKEMPDERLVRDYLLANLTDKFETRHARFVKAIDVETGVIYGYLCRTFIRGTVDEEALGAPTIRPHPHYQPYTSPDYEQRLLRFMNVDLFRAVNAQAAQLRSTLKRRSHYLLSACACGPRYQRKGIAREMFDNCFEVTRNIGEAQTKNNEGIVPTLAIVFPGDHKTYKRLHFNP